MFFVITQTNPVSGRSQNHIVHISISTKSLNNPIYKRFSLRSRLILNHLATIMHLINGSLVLKKTSHILVG